MVHVAQSEPQDALQSHTGPGLTYRGVNRHVQGRSRYSIPGRLLGRTLCKHVRPSPRVVGPVRPCTIFSSYFPTGLPSSHPELQGTRSDAACFWHVRVADGPCACVCVYFHAVAPDEAWLSHHAHVPLPEAVRHGPHGCALLCEGCITGACFAPSVSFLQGGALQSARAVLAGRTCCSVQLNHYIYSCSSV